MRGLIIVLLVLTLAGCRTKRCAVESNYVDTTRLSMDHSVYGMWTEDSVKTKAETALGLMVEFVDSGGALETDGHGGVRLKGVKRVLGTDTRTATSMASGKTAESSETIRARQENGVTAHVKSWTEERPALWWRWMAAGAAAVCVTAGVVFFVLRR